MGTQTKVKLNGLKVIGLKEAVKATSNAQVKLGDRKYNVVLITAGPGNPADKHLYSQQCIDSSAEAFEDKPCYLNHPSALEEQILPERRVEDICGYFSNVHPEGLGLCAVLSLTSTPAGDFAEKFIDDCLAYSQENPGKNLGGLSINGDGEEIPVEYNGETWLQVDSITEVFSVDIVTLPARGGEFLNRIMESYRKFKESTASDSLKTVATELRDKIVNLMSNSDDLGLKDLRRLADNLLTMVSGNQPGQPTKESLKMSKMLESKKAEAEAKAAEAEAKKKASEGEAKLAHKKLAEIHKAMASEAEAAGDNVNAALHKTEAEKHAALAGESEAKAGEGEGDLAVTTPDGTTVNHKADGSDSAVDGDGNPADDGTDDVKDLGEAKKKIESLRKAVNAVTVELTESFLDKKLQESGLPEFYHSSIRESVAGKNREEISKFIDARVKEYDLTRTSLRESAAPSKVTVTTSNSAVKACGF